MPVTDQNTLRGVAFMLATTVIFALQDGLSKALAENHSPIFVTMWRYWAFGAVCLFLLWRTGFRQGLRSGQPVLQVTRGVILALEICVAILAFRLIGLASTHAIFAFGPLLVVALSGPVLGEHVGWRRWTAILIGFCGVLIALRPSTQTVSWPAMIALGGSLSFAFLMLITRSLRATPDIVLTTTQFGGTFLLGALMSPKKI